MSNSTTPRTKKSSFNRDRLFLSALNAGSPFSFSFPQGFSFLPPPLFPFVSLLSVVVHAEAKRYGSAFSLHLELRPLLRLSVEVKLLFYFLFSFTLPPIGE